MILRGVAVLAAAALVGCSTQPPADPELIATLASPVDVTLTWHRHEPDAAGQVVEFATAPDGPFTILEFLPPDRATYRHPELLPQTPFYYRVRSVRGPATGWVHVHLPDAPASAPDNDWLTPRAVPHGKVATASIRTIDTENAAAPTDLTTTVRGADGIAFTWTDHATDEEGFLLEVQPTGSPRARVAMVLDPDITSTGLITLPDERDASYRIRSFYYGHSSNLAHVTTGGG